MRSLAHLADHVLLHDLEALVTRDRGTTADLLAHLAEAEERKLHLPAAYPSMHAYCLHVLRMSSDEALKRIRAARAARRLPVLFAAIADGRLHLSAVVLLAPHLTPESADELIEAASHRTKAEVALMVAERFGTRHPAATVRALPSTEVVPEPLEFSRNSEVHEPAGPSRDILTQGHEAVSAPASSARFELRATLDQEAHDLLQHARSLLGHAIPSGDLALILKRALTKLVEAEEKRVFAACARTRPRRGAPRGRYVPAEVRRVVWVRDGGRCTFTSESGTRCPSSDRLEFDHVQPVARGGESTVANLRLCCRAHNQYQAERTFGTGFMAQKREDARRRRRALRRPVEWHDPRDEVAARLESLGFPPDEARLGAALGDLLPGAPVEERVEFVVSAFRPERDLTCTNSPSRAT